MSFFVGEGVFELYRDVFGVIALVEQNACESYKLNQQFSFYFQKEVYFFSSVQKSKQERKNVIWYTKYFSLLLAA